MRAKSGGSNGGSCDQRKQRYTDAASIFKRPQPGGQCQQTNENELNPFRYAQGGIPSDLVLTFSQSA